MSIMSKINPQKCFQPKTTDNNFEIILGERTKNPSHILQEVQSAQATQSDPIQKIQGTSSFAR